MYVIGSQKVRSSILFDHTLSADQMLDSIRDVQQSVNEMCEITQVDIRPQMPAMFSKFVRQMRELNARALRQLYTSTISLPCEKAKYVLLMLVVCAASLLMASFLTYIMRCLPIRKTLNRGDVLSIH